MNMILQVFYSVFSALLTATAIPNEFLHFGSPFIGLIALSPLYIGIAKSTSFKKAGMLVSLQMGLVHILSSFWLGNFKDFAIFTIGGSAAVYFVAGYYIGQLLYIPFSYTSLQKMQEQAGLKPWNAALRILFFASLWTVYEWYKSTGWLAYPWGTLIMSAWKWKTITQIVAITGTWGLSFLFSLFAAIVGEGLFLQSGLNQKEYGGKPVFSSSYPQVAAFCIALFMISAVYGIFEYTKERIPVKEFEALLVQQNADSWADGEIKCLQTSIQLTDQEFKKAEEKGKTPDIVVWSEIVLKQWLPYSWSYYSTKPESQTLFDLIQKRQVPYLIGAPFVLNAEEQKYCNGIAYISNEAKIIDWYGKIQLVPFAEAIPYGDKKWVRNILDKIVGFSMGWTSGPYYTLFDIPAKNGMFVKAATPICFEDAFPYVCKNLWKQGCEVFLNITDDSWSKTDSAEYQHFVIASYRAQEFRTTLVRSTNAGYSVVVDPTGKVLDDMPLFKASAKTVKVPVFERKTTIYARFGNWLAYVSLFLFILMSVFLKYDITKAKKY